MAFNEVADKMLTLLEMGQVCAHTHGQQHTHTHTVKVYFVSRGRLKPANKKFSSVKNDYELSMNEDTTIELVGVVITSSQLRHLLLLFSVRKVLQTCPHFSTTSPVLLTLRIRSPTHSLVSFTHSFTDMYIVSV